MANQDTYFIFESLFDDTEAILEQRVKSIVSSSGGSGNATFPQCL